MHLEMATLCYSMNKLTRQRNVSFRQKRVVQHIASSNKRLSKTNNTPKQIESITIFREDAPSALTGFHEGPPSRRLPLKIPKRFRTREAVTKSQTLYDYRAVLFTYTKYEQRFPS